ncbi:MAG: hypothetical protein LBW85_09715 [Deltaproteobacteria bacterium]|jgi:hypothetical protein|nr:hypothetical protein [Deltaproteobacteria bacterium]
MRSTEIQKIRFLKHSIIGLVNDGVQPEKAVWVACLWLGNMYKEFVDPEEVIRLVEAALESRK